MYQLWARLSAVAPRAVQGILRARRGCARQTRGVSVSTPASEVPSDVRRLLVITYYFGPDGPVGGLRWAGITKYLARLGWEVSVITAAPPGGNGTSGDTYVEWCPRFWTFLDGCRLLRRLAFGRSPGSLANGSRVVPGAELSGLL